MILDNLYRFPRLSADELLTAKRNITVTTKRISDYPLHWHDFFEIEMITDGEGLHILNGKKYPLSQGCAYLIKPTDFHEVISEGGVEILNVSFRENMLGEGSLMSITHFENENIHFFAPEICESVMLTAQLLENEARRGGEYQKQLLEYLLHFFIDLSRERLSPEKLTGIQRALVYLELHFREQPHLSDVAREAGFSPTYFSELFKEVTGETYIEKLNSLRLEYACTLLSNNCSVSYACFESGFGSMSNFFTAFKKRYGVSPKEYIKAPRS